MIVRSLQLHNFRNYENQTVELPAGLIALVGDNGQGKTNLLEALCVLATTKSPLVERDRELLRWEQNEARLIARIQLESSSDERRLEYSWRAAGQTISKELQIGGVPQSVLAQWIGQLQVVAFFPHDLVLITGEPDERRRFLNIELGKTKPQHLSDLARYRRALQQRNALLRQFVEARFSKSTQAPAPDALLEWNRQLVSYGARVMALRGQFLEELAPLCDAMHRKLSGLEKHFQIEYQPGWKLSKRFEKEILNSDDAPENRWQRLLQAALEHDDESDFRRGTTGSGPHRDDLVWTLDGMDLRRFGSQGQQRLGVLALKLALAHWVRDATGEPPILLLDDALSELDARRRALVLEEAGKFPQSVLTATDARFLENVSSAIFSVAGGHVERQSALSPDAEPSTPAPESAILL